MVKIFLEHSYFTFSVKLLVFFPSPGDLPNPGIKPRTPTLQVDSLPAEPQGKLFLKHQVLLKKTRSWTLKIKSVQCSCSVVSNSFRSHGLQHSKLPCPSPNPGACSNSCPSSWWCHPIISSSVIPFSSYLQSFPASGSFPMSQLFASHGQSIGVSASASVLPMNIQDWLPLGLTGWISLQSKGLWRVFCNTIVQ